MSSDAFPQNIILVTGATRTVGTEVIRQLAGQGAYVRAAVSDMDKARVLGLEGVELTPFDYARPAAFGGMLAGVDRLLLVMPPGDFESQADAVQSLIDAGRAAGVAHIVFISMMGTARLRITAQWAVEQHLIASGVAYTILRSGWFFQNFATDTLLREDIRRGVYRAPTGNARVAGVDARDVAAVAIACLTDSIHRNRIYVLGEHRMDAREVAVIFAKVLGREIDLQLISEHDAAQVLRQSGMHRQQAKWWRIMYQLMRQGAYDEMGPDVARILGRPSIPFKQFVQDHADIWR